MVGEVALMPNNGPQLVVIGLDGATWTVMQPMIERGELPTLARWVSEGVHGPLMSLEPMLTPRIWASIDTGKVPEKHGIIDFYTATQRHLRAKPLWRILVERGWSVGLYHWLNTWPPREVDGFIVPGWLARSPATYPLSLGFLKRYGMGVPSGREGGGIHSRWQFAFRAWRQGVRMTTVVRSTVGTIHSKIFRLPMKQKILGRLERWTYVEGDLVPALIRRFEPQMVMYYTQAPDIVSHFYWEYYQPDHFDQVDPWEMHHYAGAIEDVYRTVDLCLSRIAACCGEETTVCCVSDHGFGPTTREYLPLTEMRLSILIDRISLPYRIQGCKIQRRWYLRPRQRRQGGGWREELSKVLASFVVKRYQIPLFEVIPDEDPEFVVIRLSRRLAQLRRIPEKGSVGSLWIEHSEGGFKLGDLMMVGNRISGEHDIEGIIILRGPGVRSDCRISASVLDVTPTLLAVMGLPFGEDMDGRVITEAIRPEVLDQHPVRTVPTYDDEATAPWEGSEASEGEEEIRELLRGLGYI
jgi:hypothetical protein